MIGRRNVFNSKEALKKCERSRSSNVVLSIDFSNENVIYFLYLKIE